MPKSELELEELWRKALEYDAATCDVSLQVLEDVKKKFFENPNIDIDSEIYKAEDAREKELRQVAALIGKS